MTAERSFTLVDGQSVPDDVVLGVLDQGYGRTFGVAWMEWKHRCLPWGPSRCVVAMDDDGPLGVVFGLPWRFVIDGAAVDGMRLVDGSTTPRAQRRGVFRAICRELIDPTGVEQPPVVIATATPAAQAAHVANGAIALAPIDDFVTPLLPRRSALHDGFDVLDSYRAAPTSEAQTDWDGAALRWRLDPSSGATYEVCSLAAADQAHGIAYRITAKGPVRVVAVVAAWGPPTLQARLVAALAWRERAALVQSPAGPGTAQPVPRRRRRRGQSLLCVWDRRASAGASTGDRAGWALAGVDLEGFV